MKKFYLFPLLAGLLSIQSFAAEQHATTVVRDKTNPCKVQLIIQLGIEGNDKDVDTVRMQLEPCFANACPLPCTDGTPGCAVHTTLVIKKWSAIPEGDRNGFHHIKMVNNDGLPSFVDAVGTANAGPTGGEWRRGVHPLTYCHEVLHLCGLPDRYCSRIWDSINGRIIADVKCVPGPDPNYDHCCNPGARNVIGKRCSNPCEGHEHDLMSNLGSELSCSNMLEIVTKAGLAACPEESCKKPQTIIPETYHAGEVDSNGNSIPLQIGGAIRFGYEGYQTIAKDVTPVDKNLYNGANVAASFDIQYHIKPELYVHGRIRLVDFSQVTYKDHEVNTTGGYTIENTFSSSYQFHQTGIDAMVGYEVYPNLNIYGGPYMDLNWMTNTNSRSVVTTTFMGNTTTDTYGDKKFERLDQTYWRNNIVSGGFNLGINYDLPLCGNWHVQPFLEARFPFTKPLTYKPNPKDYGNYLFNLDAGATFVIGVP